MNPHDPQDIARALGASRVVHLTDTPGGGPLDWLQLAARVRELRRRERAEDERRLVVSDATWRELESVAADLRTQGQEATPAEVAQALIERGLEDRRARKPQ